MSHVQMRRITPAQMQEGVRQLKIMSPAVCWGLSDDVPALSTDEVWLGLGCFQLLLDGEPLAMLSLRLTGNVGDRPAIELANVARIPNRYKALPGGVVLYALDYVRATFPGSVVVLSCFGEHLMGLYASHGFKVYSHDGFDLDLAPRGWRFDYGLPTVYHMSYDVPGSLWGEGSY